MAAAAGVLADADGTVAPPAAGASTEEPLARALEVIDRQSARIDELARENAQLREQNARLARADEELRELVGGQAARLAEANETIAVLQRMVFEPRPRPECLAAELPPCPPGATYKMRRTSLYGTYAPAMQQPSGATLGNMFKGYSHPHLREAPSQELITCTDLAVPPRACCCTARPLVRVTMPPTAVRRHSVDLWLCGHHYRESRQALRAAGADVEDLTPPAPEPRHEFAAAVAKEPR